MQERHNSIANALELRLSCTDPSMWTDPMKTYTKTIWKTVPQYENNIIKLIVAF